MDVLRTHSAAQDGKKLRPGPAYQDLDPVSCREDGTPLDPDTVSKRLFQRCLKHAGIRRIRLHDLRRSFVALLIPQGETPKYIQSQLDHSPIQITLDRYGHLMPDTHREAAERLDASVFGSFGRKMVEER